MKTQLSRIIHTRLALIILLTLCSCKPLKTALELNNTKYFKIINQGSNTINTAGIYVYRDTLVNANNTSKNDVITELIKFNTNKTVQFSSRHSTSEGGESITNDNVTNWLNDYASSYYYVKNNTKLIVEHYISNPTRKSWYAVDGPASAPLKFKIQFNITGNTLIKNNKRYILDKTLTNNHKMITTDFITLNK